MKVLTRKEFFELSEEEMSEYQNKAQEQMEKRIRELNEKFGDKIGSDNIFYSDDKVWERELKKIMNSKHLPLIFDSLDSAISLSLYKDPDLMREYLQQSKLGSIAGNLKEVNRTLKGIKEILFSFKSWTTTPSRLKLYISKLTLLLLITSNSLIIAYFIYCWVELFKRLLF